VVCGSPRVESMVETRIAPRHRIDKPAIAEYGGDRYSCTVRDLSTTGAAIEFPDRVNLIPIAKAFTLIVPDVGLRLACRIVWKRDYRMGVTFD
jgi:PilZ domain